MCVHFINPDCPSTTWNSWMRSRFSASEMQHQLSVATCSDEREALQHVPVGEVLAGGQELQLVLFALLGVQAPPRGVHLQERVLDEMPTAHVRDYRSRPASRPPTPTATSAEVVVINRTCG